MIGDFYSKFIMGPSLLFQQLLRPEKQVSHEGNNGNPKQELQRAFRKFTGG